jgi:hypothetical protein
MGQRVSAVDQQTVRELDSLSWIIKDKFGLQPAARLDGQHLFIVGDVWTTGIRGAVNRDNGSDKHCWIRVLGRPRRCCGRDRMFVRGLVYRRLVRTRRRGGGRPRRVGAKFLGG